MIADRRADEFEFARVEFDSRLTEHLAQKQAADEMADGQAVGFRGFVNMIGGDQAARAGHILDDDARNTGNVLTHMTRDRARVSIETAARGKANDDFDRLAFIEIVGTGAVASARKEHDGCQ